MNEAMVFLLIAAIALAVIALDRWTGRGNEYDLSDRRDG